MNKNIDDILKELIAIDPQFSQHESEVRRLVAKLLELKPDTRLDEQFVANLRSQLQNRAIPSPYSPFFMRYAFIAVLAALLIVPVAYYSTRSGGSSSAALFAMNQEIEDVGTAAFGTLASQQGGMGGDNMAQPSVRQESATMPAPAADTAVATMAYGSGAGVDAKMIMPVGPVSIYNYIYKGEPLELSESTGKVYSRTKSQASSGQIANQLRRFNFGLIDLSSYGDARVRNFELVQDRPFGYSINVSFDEGTISINPNYTQWPSMNGKEMNPQPIALSNVPSEQQAISMARSFLQEHDVNLDNYGEPIVQDFGQYRILAEGGATDSSMPAPEQLTVTFPLKIQGTEVIEDGGYPHGIQVGISVRDNRVSSVYGLTSQTYTSSSYQLETSSEKILEIAGRGGVHAWRPQPSDGMQIKEINLELGTPEKVLMHTWSYADNESKELYVPALRFPVTSAPEGEEYYPKEIVIPLTTDLLNQPRPEIMYDLVR